MKKQIEHIRRWLCRSKGQEEQPPAGPTIQEVQALEQTIAELEEALHTQRAEQEALAAQKEAQLQAMQEAMDLREQELQDTDAVTGLPCWHVFLEQAGKLLSGETPPALLLAVCLEAAVREDLPERRLTGVPEAYLQAMGKQLKQLPHSLFARDEGGRLCGILYEEDPARLEENQKLLADALEGWLAVLPPAGIRVWKGVLGTAAWPQEGQTIPELLDQARLAAYCACQRKQPGDFSLGDAGLSGTEEMLRAWMDQKQVSFLFQPIVRSQTAKVTGYRLVPVSKHPGLTDMEQITALADYFGCRKTLEALLRKESMTQAISLMRQGKLLHNARLYLQSGACLTDADAQAFSDSYFDCLKNLILELTVPKLDTAQEDAVRRQRARDWGVQTALGCGGLDPETELALCWLQPEWIRVKQDLVQGIAQDAKKQASFRKIKTYAAARKMELLADGIENAADLDMVIRLGADYLQGDYLCRPEASPPELPEKRIAQIGDAQYGKRG